MADEALVERLFPDSHERRVLLTHMRAEVARGHLWPILPDARRTSVLGYRNRGGTLDEAGMQFANRACWGNVLAACARLMEVPRTALLTGGSGGGGRQGAIRRCCAEFGCVSADNVCGVIRPAERGRVSGEGWVWAGVSADSVGDVIRLRSGGRSGLSSPSSPSIFSSRVNCISRPEFTGREAFLVEPQQVLLRQVDQHPSLVLAERHRRPGDLQQMLLVQHGDRAARLLLPWMRQLPASKRSVATGWLVLYSVKL